MKAITDAVVWVPHPRLTFERVCGMGVLERQLFLLAGAGIRRAWVAVSRPKDAEGLRLPPGLTAHWVPRDGDGPLECRPPYIAFSGDHFIRLEALQAILAAEHDRHVSYQDASRRGVVQVLPFRGEKVVVFEKRPLAEGACVRLGSPVAEGPARGWLLEGARKSHDGLMARVFDRHLSLAVTRRLLETPMTPNAMTILSSLVGLVGCVLFLGPSPAWDVAGALLVWLHSVLDGCDGEIARLKYRQSRLGGILDFWGDNVVHVALFACLGLSRYWTHGQPLYLGLAVLASAASAGSAWLAFKSAFKPGSQGPGFKGLGALHVTTSAASALKRVEDILAQRDFIYLLVLVAIFGRQDLFLWCGAIGAPIFLLILMYLTAQGAAPRGAPNRKAPPATAALTPSTRGQTS